MNTPAKKRISILSWNIRGTNNSIAKKNIRDIIASSNPNFIFKQETKNAHFGDTLIETIWYITKHEWLSSPATSQKGLSGGLITTWDTNVFKMIDYEIQRSWIWTRCSEKDNPTVISNFINIYAPHKAPNKIQLWKDLQRITDAYPNEGYCFLGDFNCNKDSRESINCI